MVSMIIPARNEEGSILKTLSALVTKVQVPYEIIVINDGSFDKTEVKVRNYIKKQKSVRLFQTPPESRGFANAIKLGVSKAHGFLVVPVMADMCDDPNTINIMYKKMQEEDCDIVCASRYTRGGSKVHSPFLQGVLSRLACFIFYSVFRIPTTDITNAFKMYRKSLLKALKFNPKSGVELSMELVLQAYLLHQAKIIDVPTIWKGRTRGKSKFKFIERLPRYFKVVMWALAYQLKTTSSRK